MEKRKPGRPKKDDPRYKQIRVRLTDAEEKAIKRNAEKNDMPISEYIRLMALSEKYDISNWHDVKEDPWG